MKISQIFKTSIFLFVCLFFITSCAKDNATKDEITTEDIEVVSHFNAHFDFSNLVESLNFTALANQNSLTDMGATSENALNYEINLDNNFKTSSGQSMAGKITFTSRMDDMRADGNTFSFRLENVSVDDVVFSGEKLVHNLSSGELDWCNSLESSAKDGSSSSGRDCLGKSDSVEGIIISGSNGITVNGVSYTTEVTEPILMSPDCAWFTSGEVKFSSADNVIFLRYNDNCEAANMTILNADKTESMELNRIHDLW